MPSFSGRCFCGRTTWQAEGPILWAALCHCEDCRRAASSDYVSWFGVDREGVTWTGLLQTYQSSKHARRGFCGHCGSPMSFETDIFPSETHLYAVTLDDPALYSPEAHIFWSEKLPWVSADDDLPRHEKGLQNAAQSGQKLL